MASQIVQHPTLQKGATRFVCQRCRQPLTIDLTFDTIEQQKDLVKELTAPLIAEAHLEELLIPDKEEAYEVDSNISRKNIPARYPFEEDNNDFTLLGETGPLSMGTLAHKPKVHALLFDIMSGQSTVDHPLCEECTGQ